MLTGLLSWGGGAWSWFMKSPVAQLGLFLVGFVFAWEVTKDRLKKDGAREQRRINDALNARETAEMVTAKSEVTLELRERVTRAEEALIRQPQFRSSDELRHDPRYKELAALILRDGAGDGE
jgi:hypothetical protein